MSDQARADALEERLIAFGVQAIKIVGSLPGSIAGRHVAGQMLRSATAAAPNYGEARGAESHADFTHKMSIVLKELNETRIWLRMAERSGLLRGEASTAIQEENQQLCRIVTAALKTIRHRRQDA